MLSGELPFGRGTLADVVLAQARGVPPLPPDLIPADAERAIRSALDADPDRRPPTPQAFATMLAAGARQRTLIACSRPTLVGHGTRITSDLTGRGSRGWI